MSRSGKFVAVARKPKPYEPLVRRKNMSYNPSQKQVIYGPKIGRNDPCPCGSGRKFKKCCIE